MKETQALKPDQRIPNCTSTHLGDRSHTKFAKLVASIIKGKHFPVGQDAPTRPSALIYVVDDEAVIATSVAAILAQSGYSTRAFIDPHEALKAAQTEPPALLLSDVMMPGMSGVDLALQMREHCPGCKVLLFSGTVAIAEFLRTAHPESHHFGLLTKPIHPSDLLRAIRGLG